LVTLVFVTITIWLLKGVTFHHWAYLPPAIIVTTALHAMLRIALTYRAKDFTANMLRSVVYMFVIWLRAVFTLFGHTWSATYSSWHRSARPGCSPPAFPPWPAGSSSLDTPIDVDQIPGTAGLALPCRLRCPPRFGDRGKVTGDGY
jgi:hypothetical protein